MRTRSAKYNNEDIAIEGLPAGGSRGRVGGTTHTEYCCGRQTRDGRSEGDLLESSAAE